MKNKLIFIGVVLILALTTTGLYAASPQNGTVVETTAISTSTSIVQQCNGYVDDNDICDNKNYVATNDDGVCDNKNYVATNNNGVCDNKNNNECSNDHRQYHHGKCNK